MKTHTAILAVLATVLILTSQTEIRAQQLWERPINEWKKDDCLKLLHSSPWTYSYTDIDVASRTIGYNKHSILGAAAPEIDLRLYSSTMIRRAMLRLNQIGQNYDQMTDMKKAAFDERNRNALECDQCKKYYVLIMAQPASPDMRETPVGDGFFDVKLADVKNNIYLLNDKGERRDVEQFVAPGTKSGFAAFYFPRFDEDQKPLISTDSKKLTVILRLGNINNRVKGLMENKVEFNVSKMIVNQQVDF